MAKSKNTFSMSHAAAGVRRLGRVSLIAGVTLYAGLSMAQTEPPKTLQANQDLANASGVGAVGDFLTKGTQVCDDKGNCRSMFGANDQLDYATLDEATRVMTGVDAAAFTTPEGVNNVMTQTGEIAFRCDDLKPKVVSGIAVKPLGCAVDPSTKNAAFKFQVCSAPSRSKTIASCDEVGIGTKDGWSPEISASWNAAASKTNTPDQEAKNGLGLSLYPNPSTGITPDFNSNSETLTAVKIFSSSHNPNTGASAVGLRVVYRFQNPITTAQLEGNSSVPNPEQHTAQWATIEKLQASAELPQYQQKFGNQAMNCLQQIQSGLGGDGKITVCDTTYYDKEVEGIPGPKTAQVTASGQSCETTEKCLNEVVETSSWSQTCIADVPMSTKQCNTVTTWTNENRTQVRTKTTDVCHEERFVAEYSCKTYSFPEKCDRESLITIGGVDIKTQSKDAKVVFEGMVDEFTGKYRLGTVCEDCWSNGYYKVEYEIDIQDAEFIKEFMMTRVHYDDQVAISINGTWIWNQYYGGYYNAQSDDWGFDYEYCTAWDESYCLEYSTQRITYWERKKSNAMDVSIDITPYLKNGKNVIRVDTGVGGEGESYSYFRISAWRPKCTLAVSNECTAYEAAQ